MSAFDPEKVLVFPLKKKYRGRVLKLIQSLSAVSVKGGGRVSLALILKIAHWDKKAVGVRLRKTRGDLMLNSRQGQLRGTFINTGKPLKEAIDKVPMMQPEIIVGKRIDGYFNIVKEQLELTRIRGVSVHNMVGDDILSFTYKVQKVIINPDSVTMI